MVVGGLWHCPAHGVEANAATWGSGGSHAGGREYRQWSRSGGERGRGRPYRRVPKSCVHQGPLRSATKPMPMSRKVQFRMLRRCPELFIHALMTC